MITIMHSTIVFKKYVLYEKIPIKDTGLETIESNTSNNQDKKIKIQLKI